MSEQCHAAISKHLAFLADNFICTENGDFSGIVTPYTYGDADAIELFIKEQRPGSLMLTDLGGAINHVALTSGRDILVSHKDKVRQIATKLNLMLVDDELVSLCSYEDVGEAMLNMAMAAKEIDGLARLARAQRIANFDRKLGTALRSKGLPFLQKQRIVAPSGMEYTVDFVIQQSVSVLTQTIGADQGGEKVFKTVSAFDELKDVADPRPRIAVVEKTLAPAKMSLLRKKADEVYTFGQVDEMIRDIKARAV
jgi:hypothetical protein